jgi:hypothetical protein
MNKRTNAVYTNEIINSYADAAGNIDVSYFAHCVTIVADNNRETSETKYNTRIKPRNVAIRWLLYFLETELYFADHAGYYPTSKQVIAWDRSHAGQLEKVLDIIEKYIADERNENGR